MKTVFFFSGLISVLLLQTGSLQAKEEAAPPALSVSQAPGEPGRTALPFEFSLSRGEWTEGRAGQIFSAGFHPAGFALPSLKEDPAPIRYPRWAVREGWQGTFSIAVEILTTGEVGRWKVMQSTGYSLLDEAATRAVQTWKFHPATQDGRPIVMCVQIPIDFEIGE